MKRTLLIDADMLIYRVASACEREVRWDEDGVHTLHSDSEEVLEVCQERLESLQEAYEANKIILTFSHQENFRKTLLPSYKAHRKDVRKPLALADTREALSGLYKTVVKPGLEADDVLGILGTQPGHPERVVISDDKDMQTLPVLLGTFKEPGIVTGITQDQADEAFLAQVLSGDATDGYPGCPGIGPERALKALREMTLVTPITKTLKSGPRKGQQETQWITQKTNDPWAVVVSRYKREGLTEEDALVNAWCARILRWDDWDHDKKEPILWTPTRK